MAVLAVLLTLLTGCAGQNSDFLSKKEPLIDSEHGVVVFSLGSATTLSPSIFIVPTRTDGKPAGFVLSTSANKFGDGAWKLADGIRPGPEGGRRLLTARSALPGTYSIDLVSSYINGYPISYTGRVQLSRPYRFTVEAGKITYLGVIEVNTSTAPNRIGQTIPALSREVPATMSVRLLDEFEEDYKTLKRIRPELTAAPVIRTSDR